MRDDTLLIWSIAMVGIMLGITMLYTLSADHVEEYRQREQGLMLRVEQLKSENERLKKLHELWREEKSKGR